MTLTQMKKEFMTLSHEEQDRLTEIFQAIRLSRDEVFVDKQKEILENEPEWINLEDLEKELQL